MDVIVTRRHVFKDYFQSESKGYYNPNAGNSVSAQIHMEPVRITDLTSHNVVYTFPTPFTAGSVPSGLGNLSVCRYELDTGTGEFIKQDVLHRFPVNLNPHLQFALTIDENEESLEGIIIEGLFI